MVDGQKHLYGPLKYLKVFYYFKVLNETFITKHKLKWNLSTKLEPHETTTLIQGSLEDTLADSTESHYCCFRLFISRAVAFVIIGLPLINAFFIMICF